MRADLLDPVNEGRHVGPSCGLLDQTVIENTFDPWMRAVFGTLWRWILLRCVGPLAAILFHWCHRVSLGLSLVDPP